MMDFCQERQCAEGGELELPGIGMLLTEQLVIAYGECAASIADNVFQTRTLPSEKLLERQPLRTLQPTQDTQALNCRCLEVPQRVKYMTRHRAHQAHDGFHPTRGCQSTCFSPRRKRPKATGRCPVQQQEVIAVARQTKAAQGLRTTQRQVCKQCRAALQKRQRLEDSTPR